MANEMISLKSSDGEIFEIEVTVAMQSNVIMLRKHEDIKKSGTGVIPLIFKSDILVKIIEYLKRHCVYTNHEGAGKGKGTEATAVEAEAEAAEVEAEAVAAEPAAMEVEAEAEAAAAAAAVEAEAAALEAEAAAVEASVSGVKDLKKFDAEFFKDMKRGKILEIAEAARYLDVKRLYDLSLQAVADMVKDKTPKQIPARIEIIGPETRYVIREQETEMEAEADAELVAEAEAEARARVSSTENIPENMEISTDEPLFNSVEE